MLEAETREAIERRAIEIMADIDGKAGPLNAEIVPDCMPHWHIVTTEPSSEDRALRHLSERGFGVYLPCFDRRMGDIVRGPIFPRHLFVFVWDVLRHWRRLRDCPGVTAILVKDDQAVVIGDRDIGRIQMMEIGQLGLMARSAGKRPRRGFRRDRAERDDGPSEVGVTISCKSHWDVVVGLDPEARVGVLHRALGLR